MILVIRLVTSGRRLLRKRTYRAPHSRHKNVQYYRENKNLVKPHQEHYKNAHAPKVKRKRRPKREVSGQKMSYRYKMYGMLDDLIVDDEELDSSD